MHKLSHSLSQRCHEAIKRLTLSPSSSTWLFQRKFFGSEFKASRRPLPRRKGTLCAIPAPAPYKGNGTSCAEQFPGPAPRPRRRRKYSIMKFLDLLGLVPPHSKMANTSDDGVPEKQHQDVSANNTSTLQDSAQQPPIKLPWFRREYDLREYGFAMVLDFGWPTSHS
ncbi:hypothetical protein NUW54_g12383 [Trametes sanguinea]|uniref:Uncharacterized protein n=1 Tax=Trametes sanguinea TaxID=158606 RepID=A0ACC1MYK5_9APHY|nr:hypothetical protein NUW54_g12383 [Trametes sanguinea]